MAKKRQGGDGAGGKEDRSNRKTAPVQVEKDLARMAAVIASHDGITQSDLVSPVLKPFLLHHYRRVQESMGKQIDAVNDQSSAGAG